MRISPLLLTALVSGLFCLTPAMAQAQTLLVEYPFAAGSRNPQNVDDSVIATTLVSANTSMVNSSSSAANLYYLLKNASGVGLAQSQSTALASDAYVSLTLTATSDPVDLGQMTFDFGNHGSSYTLHAYAFATVTIGGTTTVHTASIYDPRTDTTAAYFAGGTSAGTTNTVGRATIDLSSLAPAAAAEIRLYAWYDQLSGPGTLPSGTAYSLRVDQLAIYSQAIPEPGSAALLLLGAGSVMFLRRKR